MKFVDKIGKKYCQFFCRGGGGSFSYTLYIFLILFHIIYTISFQLFISTPSNLPPIYDFPTGVGRSSSYFRAEKQMIDFRTPTQKSFAFLLPWGLSLHNSNIFIIRTLYIEHISINHLLAYTWRDLEFEREHLLRSNIQYIS